ncbi:MAG: CvpA family protein [Clostridiales bacterium]|nr:CvpA family protein [Clostridiales bacterium]
MILDIIFFALLAVFAVLGFMCGFFKTLVSFFGWFISILVSYLLAKAVANSFLSVGTAQWLVGDGSIFDKVYNILPEGLREISMDSIREAVNSGMSQEQIAAMIKAESQGLMVFVTSLLQDAATKEMYLNSTIQNVRQVIALELTYHIYVIIVGVIFFIVLRIAVMGVSLIFKNKMGGSEIRNLGRVTGLFIGAIRGFAYACIVLMVASYASGMSPKIKNQVDASKVSVPVTTWTSTVTGKMLSGKLEDNKHYRIMINVLEQRIENGEII